MNAIGQAHLIIFSVFFLVGLVMGKGNPLPGIAFGLIAILSAWLVAVTVLIVGVVGTFLFVLFDVVFTI